MVSCVVPTLLPQPWLKAGVVSAGMDFSEAASTTPSPPEQGEESSSSLAGQPAGGMVIWGSLCGLETQRFPVRCTMDAFCWMKLLPLQSFGKPQRY